MTIDNTIQILETALINAREASTRRAAKMEVIQEKIEQLDAQLKSIGYSISNFECVPGILRTTEDLTGLNDWLNSLLTTIDAEVSSIDNEVSNYESENTSI